MKVREDLIAFPSGTFQLVGMLHQPESPRGAFVFCYPFGEERKSSHRAFVHTARALAQAKFGVLRFDYRGCGDSSGDFSEATVEGWLADVETAIALLKTRLGLREVGLLGLRFGATLAAAAAERMSDVSRLVLWEPILDGRSYFAADLRKKLIKEMLTRGKTAGRRAQLLEELERGRGHIDFDGYQVSGALYAEMAGINLTRQIGRFRGRCLLCQVSFAEKIGAHVSALQESYSRMGAQVSLAAVVEEPFWNKVDFTGCPKLIEATLKWINET